MIAIKETVYTKDLENRKLTVSREFDAPVELVWKAWTEKDLLDQWWAPKPWKANTRSMDFSEGGSWLYSMDGPDGSSALCRVNYKTISPNRSFTAEDTFCDEQGNPTDALPKMHWKNDFIDLGQQTRVNVEVTFDSIKDLEKIIEMGFKEGFAAAHGNLDELLQAQMHSQ
jgi:uncharacterized protein YndB with AHSA1/START domain